MSSAEPMLHRAPSPQGAQIAHQSAQHVTTQLIDSRTQSMAQRHRQQLASNSQSVAQLHGRASQMQTSRNQIQLMGIQSKLAQRAVAYSESPNAEFKENPESEQMLSRQEVLQETATNAAGLPSPDANMNALAPGNSNGLPSQLKAGVESLSGVCMDQVQVHYNSDKPAQLNAHAYAQGREIHVASGQEHHLPHEAWHVVQQAQGRVKPTMQLKSGNVINDDLGLEAEADKMGAQAATIQSSQNTTQLLSYRPSVAAMPMQLSYKFGDKAWVEDDRKLESKLFKEEGSDGKFTRVEADSGLPTAYGVLSSIFGKNLNSDVFKSTSSLSSNCDRPHLVAASLERSQNREERGSEDAGIVSAIGNLGDEEFMIRNGASSKRAATYHGGHLIGNQILGGDASNVAWNVAPQDANNNQFAYNNTIERMLREATPGTQYSYEVKVAYRSLNYRVNQQMLLDNQIISKLDSTAFWEIQIPARIPQLWEATATMTNQGEFASPAKTEGTTYDQLSQNLESELDEEDETHTARYKLGLENKDGNELALKNVKKDASAVRKISFSMHQVLPSDLDSQPPPKGWGTNVETDFGEVKLEQLTVEKVEKLLSDIKKQYEDIDFSELEDDIEIKDEEFPKILGTFQFGSSSDLAFQIHCGDRLVSEFEKNNYFSEHKRYCQEFETERNELAFLRTNLQKEGEILEEIESEDLTSFDQNGLLQKKRKLEKLDLDSRTYQDKKKNVKLKKQKITDNKEELESVCEEIRKGKVTREKKRNIQSFLQKRAFQKSDFVSFEDKILEIKPTETKY